MSKYKYNDIVNFNFFNGKEYDVKKGKILIEKEENSIKYFDIYVEEEKSMYRHNPEYNVLGIVKRNKENEIITNDEILEEIDNYRTEKKFDDMWDAIKLNREGKEYFCPICKSKVEIIEDNISRQQTKCSCGYLSHTLYGL